MARRSVVGLDRQKGMARIGLRSGMRVACAVAGAPSLVSEHTHADVDDLQEALLSCDSDRGIEHLFSSLDRWDVFLPSCPAVSLDGDPSCQK